MSFLDNFKGFFGKKSLTYNEIKVLLGNVDGDIEDGVAAYDRNSWVRRGVNLITDKVSSGSIIIEKNGKPSDVANAMFARIGGIPIRTFIKLIEFWRITYNFAFVRINGKKLEFIPSDKVTFSDGDAYILDSKTNKRIKLSPGEYLIFRGDITSPNLLGKSVLQPTFPYVTAEWKLIKSLNKMLDKGALFSMMIVNDSPVNSEILEKYIEDFRTKYSGVENAGKTPFLSGGWRPTQNLLDLQKIAITQIDAVVKNTVSTVLGIPISLLNDTESNTAAREKLVQDRKTFLYDTVLPRGLQIETFLNDILLMMYGRKYKITLDYKNQLDLIKDAELEENIRSKRVQGGYMTRNEAREQIGLDPLPGGDELLVPINLIPLNGEKGAKNAVSKDLKFTHDSIWKAYFKRVQPQERKLLKVLDKFFDEMQKNALSRLGKKQVKSVLDTEALLSKFEKMLTPYMLAFAQQAGDSVVSDYGLDIDFESGNPEIRGYISQVLKTSGGQIIANTEKELAPIFDEAIRNGEPVKETEKKIRELFKNDKARRPQAIARTETNRINNYSSVQAARQGGLTKKIWVSALTEDTREWHSAADNQRVGLDEPFLVGGELLQYPGDSNGSASNVVNCLCTVIFS